MAKGLRSKRMQRNKRELRKAVMNEVHDMRLRKVSENLLSLPNVPREDQMEGIDMNQTVDMASSNTSKQSDRRVKKEPSVSNTKRILKTWKSKKDHQWIPSH